MARKIKLPNESLKRFVRKDRSRGKDFRNKRNIVCEGAKTEPNYFEGLKGDLPKGVLTYYQIDIEGSGRNTQSLVDEALRLRKLYETESNRPIDRLWLVFDRDSFPANDFNSAVLRCYNSKPQIGCTSCNEAFELWYLLHFHFYNHGMSRKDYQNSIEENLKPYLGNDYRYKKNSPEMYALLKEYGNLDDAIRNAKRLVANYENKLDYSNHNPCTMVWKLIEELMQLSQNR